MVVSGAPPAVRNVVWPATRPAASYVRCCEKAADGGQLAARTRLPELAYTLAGTYYNPPEGQEKDVPLAAVYYRKAAQDGHKDAQFRHRFQREAAAFLAICLRLLGDKDSARALPPLNPPSLPSATAAGFFSGSVLDVPPVVWETMEAAIWFKSGRFGMSDYA